MHGAVKRTDVPLGSRFLAIMPEDFALACLHDLKERDVCRCSSKAYAPLGAPVGAKYTRTHESCRDLSRIRGRQIEVLGNLTRRHGFIGRPDGQVKQRLNPRQGRLVEHGHKTIAANMAFPISDKLYLIYPVCQEKLFNVPARVRRRVGRRSTLEYQAGVEGKADEGN